MTTADSVPAVIFVADTLVVFTSVTAPSARSPVPTASGTPVVWFDTGPTFPAQSTDRNFT